jgi:putative transposase
LNQVWIADLTSMRWRCACISLAGVRDAFSRRWIGWNLSRHLNAELTLAALRRALACRVVEAGLVPHVDPGVPDAAHASTDLVPAQGIRIRRRRRGNPDDHAHAERLITTLQDEEGHLNDYNTLEEAGASIEPFLEAGYNHTRLHSALGDRPPAEDAVMLTQPISP